MAPNNTRSVTLVAVAERVSSFTPTNPDITFHTSISQEDSAKIFNITKENMQAIYDTCGSSEWAWDDKKKQIELGSKRNRFLIFRQSGQIIGFIVFRFLIDDGIPVAYVWEIQVVHDGDYRGKGLGTRMMASLESLVLNETGIRKISLTVLNNNERAKKFYSKLSYIVDKSSPRGTNSCYAFLSKQLRGV